MAVVINGDSNINLDFSTGGRITGDFSNATVANRAMLQTSTLNTNTTFGIMPNGTGTNANFGSYGNALDLANTSVMFIGITNGATEARINSAITGTGTYQPITLYTGGTESLRLSATSKAVILSGGSTSANGTGITFPATQSASSDANTLDDYEEGTFSPTVIGATSGSATYTTQNGIYVKVGGWVFIQIALDFNKSTISGQLRIANLPFTSKSGINYSTSCGYWSGWATAILTPTSFLGGNTTYFVLRKLTAASTNTNTSLTDADINTSGNEIMFNVFYPVA